LISFKIKYEDFLGRPQEDEFFFNLTEGELMEMQLRANGNMVDYLNEVIESRDGGRIIEVFTNIIKESYGVLSADGKHFIKTEAEYEKFKSSPAYSKFIMDLLTGEHKAAEFVNGLMPRDLAARMKEASAQNGFRPGHERPRPVPPVAGEAPQPQVEPERPFQTATIGEPNVPTPPVQVSPEPQPQPSQNPTVIPAEAPPAQQPPYSDEGSSPGYSN
jgi:hypothetical protein